MPGIRCLTIDAFTSRPFAGNPAAVCLLEEQQDDRWMQQIAAEMNLSETAFVRRLDDGHQLRWFTPAVEVDLCGHATLAAAHALWSERLADLDSPIRFHTRSGLLTCYREGEFIQLDFPATPPQEGEPPDGLVEALGAQPQYVGRSRFDCLAVFDSERTVRALKPDMARLRQIDARGVIATAVSDDPQFDFVSRFFAPAAGVDEDPVTGSAHCCLAPYWGQQLGKQQMTAYQASQRGGVVRVEIRGDRVLLGGQAVTILRGELV